jgi:hypothetical protein
MPNDNLRNCPTDVPPPLPPPWSVEELDACFVVRDVNGEVLAYVYCEEAAAKLLRGGLRIRCEAIRCEGLQAPGRTRANRAKNLLGQSGPGQRQCDEQ